MKNGILFPGLYEELTFIALYIVVWLKRDKELFASYSPVYNEAHIAALEAQIVVVENLVAPRQLTGEMKVITKLVASDYTKIRGLANRAESYLKKVDTSVNSLTIAVSDFGIRQLRLELEAKNDEGIVKEFRALYANLENNKTVLEPKGYTAAMSTQFKTMIDKLASDSIAQNLKKDERIELTKENIQEMNKLWKMMDEVLEDGKNIAKELKNSAMAKDYTFSQLQKKVRLERKEPEGNAPATPA